MPQSLHKAELCLLCECVCYRIGYSITAFQLWYQRWQIRVAAILNTQLALNVISPRVLRRAVFGHTRRVILACCTLHD